MAITSPENITRNPLHRGMLYNNILKDNMVVLKIDNASEDKVKLPLVLHEN